MLQLGDRAEKTYLPVAVCSYPLTAHTIQIRLNIRTLGSAMQKLYLFHDCS